MKKKRNIQKLSIHKETISTLNNVTGGAKTTTSIVDGFTIATLIITEEVHTCLPTCTIPRQSGHWMICVTETDDC